MVPNSSNRPANYRWSCGAVGGEVGVGVSLAPVVGEELGDVRRGGLCIAERGQASEHVAEPGEGFDVVGFGAGDHREQHRGGASAVVVAGEEPILATDGRGAAGAAHCVRRRSSSRRHQ